MTTSGNNKPSSFWTGATVGVAVGTIVVCALAGYFALTGLPGLLGALAWALVASLLFFGLVKGLGLSARALARIPPSFYCAAAAGLVTLYVMRSTRFRFRADPVLFYPSVLVFLAALAVLVGVYRARRELRANHSRALVAVALAALVAGFVWVRYEGRDPFPVEPSSSSASVSIERASPAEQGDYDVEALTYGSGTDERRPEFGRDVDVISRTVDASRILPDWKGFKARARQWYWGFSIDAAPLNARVWMPSGDGPFPLVLVVHGNHGMEDHSDAGYAYLGELLASRGFITASVDENFINGTWSGDFRGKEMPMRAWLLLEHLRSWHEWNETPGHRFHGKVDTERIALMGHSRGGEAVSVAYAFNTLSHFPNDATVRFDYGYSIRALVAIAQTDRHYPRRVKLDDVNFLTLQGSYDSDEASSFGMRQFRRITLGDGGYRFKAGIYIHGANHGQFNTTWGMDSGPPSSWWLNRAALVSPEEQEAIARVYVSAFLEATLHEDEGYVPLFRDPRTGARWLPDGVVYLAQFQDSTFRAVADFEEDLDVTTASFPAAEIEADELTLWREEELRFRDDLTQGTSAVVIGSDGNERGRYNIRFDRSPEVSADSALTFFLSSSTEKVGEGDESLLELTLELEDETGAVSAVDISDVSPITPPLRVQFLKAAWLNRKRFPKNWEATFQTYEVPVERFGSVDAARLSAIRFMTRGSGVVILDDIGFRSLR